MIIVRVTSQDSGDLMIGCSEGGSGGLSKGLKVRGSQLIGGEVGGGKKTEGEPTRGRNVAAVEPRTALEAS